MMSTLRYDPVLKRVRDNQALRREVQNFAWQKLKLTGDFDPHEVVCVMAYVGVRRIIALLISVAVLVTMSFTLMIWFGGIDTTTGLRYPFVVLMLIFVVTCSAILFTIALAEIYRLWRLIDCINPIDAFYDRKWRRLVR